ncbi:Uncharacterized protein APZ42_027147 [Daphnia magna]|uniref:Uncharacterized protein n=1 Tax=Daphnia magna TaxID=35525 RepID=A0A164RB48_9CRUS|nr:Uncharacterized protein APZ42_027147 [Daphnia magna]
MFFRQGYVSNGALEGEENGGMVWVIIVHLFVSSESDDIKLLPQCCRRKKSKNKAEQQSEEEVTEEPHHLEHDSPGSSNSKSSSTQQQQSGANLRSAATSLIVTASHLLLYLPALLLLGLQGTVVNPVAAALCALIVYSEFLIHPMVLLSTSRRMRQEVLRTLKRHSPCCC